MRSHEDVSLARSLLQPKIQVSVRSACRPYGCIALNDVLFPDIHFESFHLILGLVDPAFVPELQDFANQVRYSELYGEALMKTNSQPGKYVSPRCAEFFSGLA